MSIAIGATLGLPAFSALTPELVPRSQLPNAVSLNSTSFTASQAVASPADSGEVMTAAADCYSVGEQVAAQYGGTLAKASQQNNGGQIVCVIVVLVPGKDGQRPRHRLAGGCHQPGEVLLGQPDGDPDPGVDDLTLPLARGQCE